GRARARPDATDFGPALGRDASRDEHTEARKFDAPRVGSPGRLAPRSRRVHAGARGLLVLTASLPAWLLAPPQRLVDPARKVIALALDLGHSAPAHFTRAFARWTGLAPRAFRRLRGPFSG